MVYVGKCSSFIKLCNMLSEVISSVIHGRKSVGGGLDYVHLMVLLFFLVV